MIDIIFTHDTFNNQSQTFLKVETKDMKPFDSKESYEDALLSVFNIITPPNERPFLFKISTAFLDTDLPSWFGDFDGKFYYELESETNN